MDLGRGGNTYLRWKLFFFRENKHIQIFSHTMMKLGSRGYVRQGRVGATLVIPQLI